MNTSPKYALLVPTSMGVRLTPSNGQPAHSATSFELQVTSAETNVASVLSYLGMPVKVLTALVQGHPFAARIRSDLRGRGMDVEAVELEQGGPWGLRHQINIADTGAGPRGPRVWNDRSGEAGRELKAGDFNLERIFCWEGVRMMHLSGLVAAIAPGFCLDLAEKAHKYGCPVSFDLNYRASFWKGQEKQLRDVFTRIASLAEVLIGNEEDFQLCLGIEGPEVGGNGLAGKTEAFKSMLGRIRERFPGARVVATTLREVLDAGTHLWGAVVADAAGAVVIEPREIHVLDRIGGGDGFVGGLLYGILKGWSLEECADFGWASGALAVTLPTDYAIPADEQQIWSIWKGNARVLR
ncbi:MAG: sugar kinase [Bacteroidales bacterium]|nr:sugar kinase [Bacteroidales bacterium]